MSLLQCGYVSKEELVKCPGFPSEERMAKGAVAVIECVQEIPCNPCEYACPQKAVVVGDNITNLPVLREDLCIGCGLCIACCPGLAIFVVNKAYSETEATVEFPYEYNNIPGVGETAEAVDRKGNVVCRAKVLSVRNPPSNDHTSVIKIAIPKEYADDVRGIKRRLD